MSKLAGEPWQVAEIDIRSTMNLRLTVGIPARIVPRRWRLLEQRIFDGLTLIEHYCHRVARGQADLFKQTTYGVMKSRWV